MRVTPEYMQQWLAENGTGAESCQAFISHVVEECAKTRTNVPRFTPPQITIAEKYSWYNGFAEGIRHMRQTIRDKHK